MGLCLELRYEPGQRVVIATAFRVVLTTVSEGVVHANHTPHSRPSDLTVSWIRHRLEPSDASIGRSGAAHHGTLGVGDSRAGRAGASSSVKLVGVHSGDDAIVACVLANVDERQPRRRSLSSA